MSTLDAVKRGLTVLLAVGGLAGPVAVIVYTSSRASADDLAAEVKTRAVLQQKHDDLRREHDDLVRRVDYRLDRMDTKQDRMLEILERRR